MKKKRREFLIVFILMLFILIVSINVTILSIFPTKTTTAATSQSNIEFSIAKSKGIEIKTSFFGGDSTDFTVGGNSALKNITNMTLEKSNYGKIIFTESIDLTQDVQSTKEDDPEYSRQIDLDSSVIISHNLIEINTANLPSLNKPAILYLYNLDFNNPRILRNNEVCPSSICQIISYSPETGFLIFSVTKFSSYSSEETPIEEIAGGGACTYDWKCTDWQPLICPETGMQTRACTNKGTCSGIIGKPSETETCLPGEIPEEALFDVKVSMITEKVYAGDEVRAEIELIKFAGGKADADVYYSIKDQFNNIITAKTEIIAVETKTSFIGKLNLPSEAPPGTYTFYVRLISEKQILEASESFEVIKKLIEISNSIILLAFIIMFFIFTIILYFIYKRIKKLTTLSKIVTEEDLIRMGYIKRVKGHK